MSFEVRSKEFWDAGALSKELTRVYDICNGCRRCFNLCPSFSVLFNALDDETVDGDAEKLAPRVSEKVVDLCFECKLCFNHCPYTPPHRWDLDFPRIMLRAKLVKAEEQGIAFEDRALGDPDRIGRIGALAAPLVNFLNRNRLARRLMEKVVGIHRAWPLPTYRLETWQKWFAGRAGGRNGRAGKAPPAARKIAFFATCSVNYNDVETGKDAVRVLERNGVEVRDGYVRCCGMPFLDGGDLEAATRNAEANLRRLGPLVREGFDIVSPGPTCSYVLKQEYPLLVPTEEAKEVAAHSFDLAEYLMRLHAEGALDTRFPVKPGKIAYQMPCHLRAQNVGYKSRDLMALTGARVVTVEKCSAVDGTWGMKTKYHSISMDLAKPMLREIEEAGAESVATDCPLSALRIREGSGREAVHPVRVLARAYGMDREDSKS